MGKGRIIFCQRLEPEIRDSQTYDVAGNCAETTKYANGQARGEKGGSASIVERLAH